jgi:predicted nuclease of predicted toxin-antitoxin system
MRRTATKLHFFLDNNVPDSVGRYLQGRGHSVKRQRFHIAADAPDPVVAVTAMESNRILVTQDKDFNSQRFHQERFARLSRVSLSGPSHTLIDAIKEHLHLIEFQAQHTMASGGSRVIAHVKVGQVRFRS